MSLIIWLLVRNILASVSEMLLSGSARFFLLFIVLMQAGKLPLGAQVL